MKKLLTLGIAIILTVGCCLTVSAAGHAHGDGCYTTTEGHKHTGSTSSGGGCYTTPVYHSHIGSTSSGDGCYTTPVYHSHIGSTSSGGSCYATPVYHSHTGSSNVSGGCYTTPEYCGGSITANSVPGGFYIVGVGAKEYATGACPFCGKTHGYCVQCGIGYSCGGFHCNGHQGTTITYNCSKCGTSYSGTGTCTKLVCYKLSCGKTTSTVESYRLSCGKDTATIDSYSLSCGKDTTTIDSYSLSCGKAECEATRKLTCTIPESSGEPVKPSESPTPSPNTEPSELPKASGNLKPSQKTETEEQEAPMVTEKPKVVLRDMEPKLENEIIEETVEILENEIPKASFVQMAAPVAATTGTGGMVFFAIFWIFRKCIVLNSSKDRIGKAYIKKKKGDFFIKIPSGIYQKSEDSMVITFKPNFVKKYMDRLVKIDVNGCIFEELIQEEITINVEEWGGNDE